jgi:hypothetical protein
MSEAVNCVVTYAVYGALAGGNENQSQAISVANALQAAINASTGIVAINTTNLGGCDPSPGNQKHFAGCVVVGGVPQYYACQEGQTIDFYHVGTTNCTNC